MTFTITITIIAIIAITRIINLATRTVIVVDDILLPQRVTRNYVVVFDDWWTNYSCWDMRYSDVFFG